MALYDEIYLNAKKGHARTAGVDTNGERNDQQDFENSGSYIALPIKNKPWWKLKGKRT